VSLVTVLVGLGFLITVVLAWAFDMGPGGIHRTAETMPAEASPLSSNSNNTL
jgi:hypothetical protein